MVVVCVHSVMDVYAIRVYKCCRQAEKEKMTARKKIPKEIEGEVIYRTDYKCCVCQDGTRGDHIHHIDENRNNNKIENLAFLCFPHHDEASKRSLSKKLPARAIKKFRDSWYDEIAEKRKKRRETSITPIKDISQENLVNAALNANVIIEIIKIREKYFDAEWKERKEILRQIHPYAEYSNFRISYEVFLFLSHVVSQTRSDMPAEIISSVYWLASAFYIGGENDKEQVIAKEAINMASDIIYDATIYRKNLEMVACGCNILKLVYQNAFSEEKKNLREEIRKTYKELEDEFLRREEKDYSKFLAIMQVFKEDLDKWGLALPLFPEELRKEII